MLEAPFRLIRDALPHMYGQGWGRIVNEPFPTWPLDRPVGLTDR